jgi:hypothetical protein
LSWNNRLQDNQYYQEFSYVIRVAEVLEKYKSIIKSLVHPAGSALFGDYMISSSVNIPSSVIDAAPSVAQVTIIESITAATTQTASAEYNYGINVTESITAATVQNATFVANSAITEAITAVIVDNATFVANTSISESITAIVAEDGTFVANSAIVESITVISTEEGPVTFNGSIGVLVGDYSPFLISTEASTQVGDITINLYDTVDATVT